MYVYICLDLIDPFVFYSCSKTSFIQRICLSSFTNSVSNPIFFLSTKVRKQTFLSRRTCIQPPRPCGSSRCRLRSRFPRLSMRLSVSYSWNHSARG